MSDNNPPRKYCIGETVQIADSETLRYIGEEVAFSLGINDNMLSLAGTIATIRGYEEERRDDEYYVYFLAGYEWYWHEDMLRPVSQVNPDDVLNFLGV